MHEIVFCCFVPEFLMNRVLIYLVLSDAVTSESGEPVRRYLLVFSSYSCTCVLSRSTEVEAKGRVAIF